MSTIPCIIFALLLAIGGTAAADDEPSGLPVAELQRDTPVDFGKEILPLLKRNCLACHHQSSLESDVVLESPAHMADADTDPPLLSPKNAANSQLFLVASHRSETVMPPEDNDVGAKPLSPEELALLRLWIEQGAGGSVSQRNSPIPWRNLPASFGPVYAVNVAPAGDLVAAGRGNRIDLYHVPSQRWMVSLTDPTLSARLVKGASDAAHLDLVQSLTFTPDGERLISGGYRVAKIWRRCSDDLAKQIGKVDAPPGAVAAAGNWVAVGDSSGKIQVFDAAKGRHIRVLEADAEAISALAFSSDAKRLVSASLKGDCAIWEIETGRRLAQWQISTPLEAVAWCKQDTQIVGGGQDAALRVWRVPETTPDDSLEPTAQWQGHSGPVSALVRVDEAGNQIVSASQDGSIRLWEVAGNRQLRQITHGGPVIDVAIAEQRMVSVGSNGIAKLFRLDNGQRVADLPTGQQFDRQVAAVRRENEIASRFVNAAKADVASAEKQQKAAEEDAAKAAEEVKQAEADLAKKAEVAKAAKENEAKKATAEKAIAERTLQASRDRLGRMQANVPTAAKAITEALAAVARAEQVASQLQPQLAAAEQQVASAKRTLAGVAISASTSTVAVADREGRLYRFDFETGAYLDQLDSTPTVAVASSGAGHVITVAADGQVVSHPTGPRWELERTLGGDSALPTPIDRVTATAISPDGRIVATGGGEPSRSGEVMLWDLRSGKLIQIIPEPHSDTVLGLAFSPRGRYLASCGADRQMKVFEVATGRLGCTCEGHTHHVLSVACRADGRMLATGGADKVVKVWSFPSGDQQKTIEGFDKEITSLHFLGLSDNIVTASGNGTVTTKTSSGGGGPTYAGTAGFIYSAGSSADGRTIAAGGERGILWVWPGGTTPVAFSSRQTSSP